MTNVLLFAFGSFCLTCCLMQREQPIRPVSDFNQKGWRGLGNQQSFENQLLPNQ